MKNLETKIDVCRLTNLCLWDKRTESVVTIEESYEILYPNEDLKRKIERKADELGYDVCNWDNAKIKTVRINLKYIFDLDEGM